jgi:hypothetical protein
LRPIWPCREAFEYSAALLPGCAANNDSFGRGSHGNACPMS